MEKIIKKNKKCRICFSRNLQKVLTYPSTPIGDEFKLNKYEKQPLYPIELNLCSNCGLSQLLHVINPKVLYSKYIYKTSDSPGLKNHFNELCSHVLKKYNLKKKSNILDIGSNDGVLLNAFKKKGFNVVGIEPAKKLVKIANNLGIKTYEGFLNRKIAYKVILKEKKFDLIFSNNVLANVNDINEWVSNIKILLNSNGLYIFETYYLLDLIKNSVFDFIYHEHLSSFAVKPLYYLFKKFGLDLFYVENIKTKGGSIRCYVRHGKFNDRVSNNVNRFIKNEIKNKIFNRKTFKIFHNKINKLKMCTNQEVKNLHKCNKKIIGYGASISCVTLMYHFQINNYLDYLVDDNKTKINTYSPGQKIKVISFKDLLNIDFDVMIILAWRFSDTILSKIRKIYKNKIVILPCPSFKIIRL
jgi:2-polyprenyl-3-methyl-5-hydroxy-6-metoxy-1,4-benzoquinol methylase